MLVNHCPSCQFETLPGAKYCDHCGFALFKVVSELPAMDYVESPTGFACQQCGHRNLETARYCEICGLEIKNMSTVSVSAKKLPYFFLPQYDCRLEFPLNKNNFLLGRIDEEGGIIPDIDLTPYEAQNLGIGRKHAVILLQGEDIYIKDLNSVNGTVVNQVRIPAEKPYRLGHDAEIRLGKLVLIFRNCE